MSSADYKRGSSLKSPTGLIDKVLGDPTLYPDEFKAWIPRWVAQNVNFQLQKQQLPTVQRNNIVGSTGAAPFLNSWVNFSAADEQAHYYIDPFNRVFVGGRVKSGTIGTPILTLPVGYRPQYALAFPVVSNGLFGICTVGSDGNVTATSGSNASFSLAGINFRQYS